MHAVFSADEILYATSSHLRSGEIDESRGNIIWNIEEVKPGDWFIAIPSPDDDPHDYLDVAISKGARGVIVNRRGRYSSASGDSPVITVPDTKTALLDLMRYWRYCVKPTVVGVSGSFGRRATMVLLSQLIKSTHQTHVAFMGNLGWFGCVKEVLSMPRSAQVLIFEAGAVERGDITRIGGALDPDLAILTQIRHPIASSPERDAFAASLYCELLETLSDSPTDRLSAVIYDDNAAVRKRAEKILGNSSVQRHSTNGNGIAHRVPQCSMKELSLAMESVIGQPVTRAELWCAAEAAIALGVSTRELEDIFGLPSTADAPMNARPVKQIA